MGLFNLSKSSEEQLTNKKFKFAPDLPFEREMAKQIYEALQGQVLEEVLAKLPSSNDDAAWRSNMEGHSLKVEKELLKDVYELCHEVQDSLGYTGKVDYYITGNTDVNAFSVASADEDHPSIVNINSGLFSLMNTDELKFVIGHELGHLINRDTALSRLIRFVFPDGSKVPVSLQYKIRLHSQLAELVADRYGFLAVGDLYSCVSAFFKMASGLDIAKVGVSLDALIADNNKHLEYFLHDEGTSAATHPVNPIRVQALNLYATCETEEQLNEGVKELISILLKLGDGKISEHIARFMASAGLIVAGIDTNNEEGLADEEIDHILENLSGFKFFPREFLQQIANSENIGEILQDSVYNIMNQNPGLRDGMLDFMISTVLADKKINQSEVDLLYNFGNMVQLSEMEVAQAIAQKIQQNFVPGIDAIC